MSSQVRRDSRRAVGPENLIRAQNRGFGRVREQSRLTVPHPARPFPPGRCFQEPQEKKRA